MIKRVFVILLVFTLCLQPHVMAFAQNGADVTLSSAMAMPGQEATITVSVSNCPAAKSIYIMPQYDDQVLEIVSGNWLVEGMLSDDYNPAFGDAAIAFSGNTDINTDIFCFVFKVKDGAENGTIADVSCDVVIMTIDGKQEAPVTAQVHAGQIAVESESLTGVVTLSSAVAMPGQEISITVSVSNCPAAKSIYIMPQYDDQVLEIVSGNWLVEGMLSDDYNPAFGDAAIAFSGNTDINTDVFCFVFKVKEGVENGVIADASCDIVIMTMDGKQEVPVTVQVHAGWIKVESQMVLGDANGDGRVTVGDARAILRYMAGLTEEGEVDEASADFNGDGRVTVSDARAILRHIAGLD